ncbi:MAG: hypothetical protein ACRCY9_09880 [Phycicoccus sp.]
MIRTLLGGLLAVLVGWLAVVPSEVIAEPSVLRSLYAYDHHHAPTHVVTTPSPCAPPGADDHTFTVYDAIDRGSHGALARSRQAGSRTPSVAPQPSAAPWVGADSVVQRDSWAYTGGYGAAGLAARGGIRGALALGAHQGIYSGANYALNQMAAGLPICPAPLATATSLGALAGTTAAAITNRITNRALQHTPPHT